MKTKYNFTRENSKKVYLDRLKKMDILYFILANILYFTMTFELMRYNLWIVFLFYILYILIFLLILWGFNHLFTSIMLKFQDKENPYGSFLLEIKEDKLLWGTKKEKLEIDLKTISKLHLGKKNVDLYVKENGKLTCFAFYQEYFSKTEDFEKFKNKLEPYQKNGK